MKILMILFSVIKYILIIILILVFLIFILLFSPLKYRFMHKKNSEMESYADVKYLGGTIRYTCFYKNDKFTQSLKIFGYNIFNRKERKEKKESRESEFAKPILKQTDNDIKDTKKENSEDEKRIHELRKKAEILQNEYNELKNENDTKTNSKEDNTHKKLKHSELKENKSLLKKPNLKKSKNSEKKENINENKLKEYFNSLSFEEKKEVFILFKDYLKKVLHHLKIKKYYVSGEFGFDDPAKTGVALGIISTVNGIIGEKFDFTADFNEEKLIYEIKGLGKINIGILAFFTVQFALNKKILKIIKLYLKG